MRYDYRITGISNPGQPVWYAGIVDAVTPKSAILTALACEFGDTTQGGTALQALEGWIDTEDLHEALTGINQGDHRLELVNDNTTFIVTVKEDFGVKKAEAAESKSKDQGYETWWANNATDVCLLSLRELGWRAWQAGRQSV